MNNENAEIEKIKNSANAEKQQEQKQEINF